MAILTGPEIVRLVNRTKELLARPDGDYDKLLMNEFGPGLDITPFDPERAGPNSYDVTLSNELLVYFPDEDAYYRAAHNWGSGGNNFCHHLDVRERPATTTLLIPPEGFTLLPGFIYLGSTVEKTATCGLVPWLDGRSSVGRAGIFVHATAGRGDDGFGWPHGCRWTLELSVVQPVRVYPNFRLGQVTFFTLLGARKPYAGRYLRQDGPVESRLYLDGAE